MASGFSDETFTYSQLNNKSCIITIPSLEESLQIKNTVEFRNVISQKLIGVEEIILTYNTISILFKKDIHLEEIINEIEKIKNQFNFDNKKYSYTKWEIPICFHSDYCEDLYTLYNKDKKKVEAYQKNILKREFTFSFMGFLPGFLYLSGLSKQMYIPRKSTPSLNMKKGTVAVGNNFLGIYPQESPGGWWSIGRTPIAFFDRDEMPPYFLNLGDKIVFIEIDLNEFEHLSKSNKFQLVLNKEIINEF